MLFSSSSSRFSSYVSIGRFVSIASVCGLISYYRSLLMAYTSELINYSKYYEWSRFSITVALILAFTRSITPPAFSISAQFLFKIEVYSSGLSLSSSSTTFKLVYPSSLSLCSECLPSLTVSIDLSSLWSCLKNPCSFGIT